MRRLAVVLLDLRRRLINEYGKGPAAIMLIDRAVSAYQGSSGHRLGQQPLDPHRA
jgi:hypothetical protein